MLGLNTGTLHQQANTKINTLSTTTEESGRLTKIPDFKISKRFFFPEDLQKEIRCLVSIGKPLNNAKIRNLASPILPPLSSVSNSPFEHLFANPVRMLLHSALGPTTPSHAMAQALVDLGMWRVCPKTGAGTRSAQTCCRPQEKALVSRTY